MTDKWPAPPTTGRSADRRFARDLALLFGIPLVIIVALVIWWGPRRTYAAPPGSSVFEVATGTWDWEQAEEFCEKNPHTIGFSPDSSVMILTHKEPWTDGAGVEHRVAEYDIWEHTRNRIRGRIRGELRLTESGEPVVWDLVLSSPDAFRWHRTDWVPLSYTPTVRRCDR